MNSALMDSGLKKIQDYVKEARGFDFSAYTGSLIETRLMQRLQDTHCRDYKDYFQYMTGKTDELDCLINALTIKISRFFRNAITFDFIETKILPNLILNKARTADRSFRVWSAGCSTGEEPYSIAMLLNEVIEKEGVSLNFHIFATDVDKAALKKAEDGIYEAERIRDVKYGFVKKYFIEIGERFKLVPEIRKSVLFASYDMLDKKSYAPSESVFGNFDMVFCRNVLIYFSSHFQDTICGKFLRALSRDGYLVLGETEMPAKACQPYFRRVTQACHIYQKHGNAVG